MSWTFSTRKFVSTWTVLTLISLAQALEPIDQETQQEQASESPRQEKITKEKRGSLVAAPIPMTSPAIGSGVVLAGGYIFSPRKSDKISQPSTIGGAVLITDNGTRAWGLGGEFYLKHDTYHITTIYFRGNINYDF